MPKVYIIDSDSNFEDMFISRGWEPVEHMEGADLVQFTGGADVSPSLYGQAEHPRTHTNHERDRKEVEMFWLAKDYGIPTAGICRGGQFLNVMCKGSMFQHVEGHALFGTHMMVDVMTGQQMAVTSTHHQMMRPGENCVTVAVASESKVAEHMEGEAVKFTQMKRGEDVEVLFYPEQRALCFQPHPEYMPKDTRCQDYYFELIEDKLCVG
jgi:gamma-glutamyl-gamma-aminobutyrate hydrolase PuuD